MEGGSPKDEMPPAAPKKRKARVPVPEIPEMPHPHVPTTHGGGHGLPIHIPFLEQIKRRNVGRVAILYVVLAYLTLEVFEMFFHLLEMPAWTGRVAVAVAVLGLPAAMLFAWAYEVTPEGIKPSDEVDPKKSIATQTGRRLDFAIMALMAVALTYFVVDKFWLSKHLVAVSVSAASSTKAAAAASIVPEKSIAVLPFVDMSEKHDQEYFSDGLSEELIDHLAHNADLKVIARTSSFAFKGKSEDMRSIAAKLGVANLLEGSVRKAGTELRITAQLIRASDGVHLWSQTYERRLRDIFKVQDEISTTVAKALQVAISKHEAPETPESNMEAYNLRLQASFFAERQSQRDTEHAVALYKQTLDLDPNNALTWAKLGSCYFNQALASWVPPTEGLALARAAYATALKIDPDLLYAHFTMGEMHLLIDWDWAGAQVELSRMRTLDSQDQEYTPYLSADLAFRFGRLDEAIETYRHLLERNPLEPVTFEQLATVLFAARRTDESIAVWRRLIEVDPEFGGARSALGINLMFLHRYDQALAEIESEKDDGAKAAALPLVYWALGRRADANEALRNLQDKYGRDSPYSVAENFAFRGEIDTAYEWLKRAYLQHDSNTSEIKSDPLLASLRRDPRYVAFLRTLKLPET